MESFTLKNVWGIAFLKHEFPDTYIRKCILNYLGIKPISHAYARQLKHLHKWVDAYVYDIHDKNDFKIDKDITTRPLHLDEIYIYGIYTLHSKPKGRKHINKTYEYEYEKLWDKVQEDEDILCEEDHGLLGGGGRGYRGGNGIVNPGEDAAFQGGQMGDAFDLVDYSGTGDEFSEDVITTTRTLDAPTGRVGGAISGGYAGATAGGGSGGEFSWAGGYDPLKGIPNTINHNLYETYNLPSEPVPLSNLGTRVIHTEGRANVLINGVAVHNQLNNRLRTSLDQAFYGWRNSVDGETQYDIPDAAGLNDNTNSQWAKFLPNNEATYWRISDYKQYYRKGPGLYSFNDGDPQLTPGTHDVRRKYPLQNPTVPNSFYKIAKAMRPEALVADELNAFKYDPAHNQYDDYLEYETINPTPYWNP